MLEVNIDPRKRPMSAWIYLLVNSFLFRDDPEAFDDIEEYMAAPWRDMTPEQRELCEKVKLVLLEEERDAAQPEPKLA